MRRILYLSHDGLLDPLGQSQILPYLVRLAGATCSITLLTFEKRQALAERDTLARVRAMVESANIRWIPLRYHRRPPILSTVGDMARGLWRAWRVIRREHIEIVHARSLVMAYLGVVLKRLTGVRLIFDMRELWVDGRVDGGRWRRGGWLHRLGKRCERWCLKHSEAIVSLTADGKHIVEGFDWWEGPVPPIAVIPTCVDYERFAAHRVDEPAPEFLRGRRTVCYLGSVGTWYRLDAMVDCFRLAATRWSNALLLILTPQRDLARGICVARGLHPAQYEIRTVSHEEIPQYLRWAWVGLYFITPSYAKRSSCPTKLGESLAAGLPVFTNTGVGDQDALINGNQVGVLVESFDEAAYARGWEQLEGLLADEAALRARCRQVAQEHLGLGTGVEAYRRLYDTVCPA